MFEVSQMFSIRVEISLLPLCHGYASYRTRPKRPKKCRKIRSRESSACRRIKREMLNHVRNDMLNEIAGMMTRDLSEADKKNRCVDFEGELGSGLFGSLGRARKM